MVTLGFLNPGNAPTEEARKALSEDIQCTCPEIQEKTVLIFLDESTFQANDDQATFWGMKDTRVMCAESRGSGIMVSDFIDEYNGYLGLTMKEYEKVKEVIQLFNFKQEHCSSVEKPEKVIGLQTSSCSRWKRQ